MLDQEEINSKFGKLIVEYVQEHWENSGTICYLSSIGTHLNNIEPNGRDLLTNGLREFLRKNPVVKVVQFPEIAEKVGAVPLSASLPSDIKELFDKDRSVSRSQSRRVYVQEFWYAFIHPIKNSPRYILVDKNKNITIQNDCMDIGNSNAYEIKQTDLTSTDIDRSISEKVNATHLAIDNWLNKHSLNPTDFLRRTSRKQDPTTNNRLSQFLGAFQGLPSDDLARIDIPLDILLKLNKNDDG